MRQELAALEADLQLCERCWGPERRTAVRYGRSAGQPSVLALLERPPRGPLARGERLGFQGDDAALRQNLLFQPADGQHVSAQGQLSRHRDPPVDGSLLENGDDGRGDGDAGGRTVLGDRSGGNVTWRSCLPKNVLSRPCPAECVRAKLTAA